MLKTLGRYVGQFKRDSFLTPCFMLIEVIMETVLPLIMASIIDQGITKGNINHVYLMGGLMLLTALVSLFAGIMGGRFGASASTGFGRNLRKAMFENIQTFSFSNIDTYSTSSLVTRLTTDVTNLQNSYQMILRMGIRAPFSMIISMTMAFLINAKLATIYLVAVVFLGIALISIATKTMKYFRQVFEKYDEMNRSVQENVAAIRVVKAYVQEDYERQKFKRAAGNIYNMFVKAESLLTLNGPIMSLTVYTCIILISWFGAKFIIRGEMTTGEMTSLLSYCMAILMNLMMLSMMFVMMTMSAASAKRICEVLEQKSDLTNPENPIMEVPDGSIDFDDVDFSYSKDARESVLKDIDLHIKSGEIIGIIGATGSAKSSLVNLISRLYDVTSGTLKVGGNDVRKYDLVTLRDNVSVVLQKNVLFTGTIYDNLRWGNKNATEEECRRAAKLACIDDFIESLPEGYNTKIEQGGSNVSGGQKQRLCIARALLKNPKILILDDSTSAVDTATDARIRKAFAEEIPDTTKLIISQRISSIQHADRILVLREGRVDGFASHDELVKTNEIYRSIVEAQTQGSGDFDEKGGEL
ncbi:MAG: ABC transporter ATP-binding protein/permease [Clostridiales bacterium]|nr:ABC transporter ATP-binding protein/permease [Clostridiales bacterium]